MKLTMMLTAATMTATVRAHTFPVNSAAPAKTAMIPRMRDPSPGGDVEFEDPLLGGDVEVVLGDRDDALEGLADPADDEEDSGGGGDPDCESAGCGFLACRHDGPLLMDPMGMVGNDGRVRRLGHHPA